MPYGVIRAREIKVGDIIAATSTNPMVNVKKVDRIIHPVTGLPEVKITGPLGIVIKYPHTARVSMVRTTAKG